MESEGGSKAQRHTKIQGDSKKNKLGVVIKIIYACFVLQMHFSVWDYFTTAQQTETQMRVRGSGKMIIKEPLL